MVVQTFGIPLETDWKSFLPLAPSQMRGKEKRENYGGGYSSSRRDYQDEGYRYVLLMVEWKMEEFLMHSIVN